MTVTKDQVLGSPVRERISRLMKLAFVLCHNLPDSVHQLLPFFIVVGLEDETKSDFRLTTEQLRLDILDERLINIREGFEDDRFHGEASSLLLETGLISRLFVEILEKVQSCICVEWVKQGLVTQLDPIDNLSQVSLSIPRELVKGEPAKESVQIFKEQGQLVFESRLVEVYDRLRQRVILKVQIERTVEGSSAGQKQSDWKLWPNVIALAPLVV